MDENQLLAFQMAETSMRERAAREAELMEVGVGAAGTELTPEALRAVLIACQCIAANIRNLKIKTMEWPRKQETNGDVLPG